MPVLADLLYAYAPMPSPLPIWNWQGVSGRWYPHSIYDINGPLLFGSANYIMVRRQPDGRREALYIGETLNGTRRFAGHEKLLPAILMGATELHVHFLAEGERARLAAETDLRHGHRPVLNQQDRPMDGLAVGGLASFYSY